MIIQSNANGVERVGIRHIASIVAECGIAWSNRIGLAQIDILIFPFKRPGWS